MTDIITRLKLESSEYDNRIKRATQGLLQMEQECRKVGGTLAVLEKDQLDFVRGLGQMETVSRSARGKVSELTSAFTELSVQYKRLSDEEKKGDYGKALSASLDQLKVRIKDARTDLIDVEKELKGMGDAEKIAADGGVDFSSVLNQLGSQLGINTNLLNMVTTGTIATTAAVTAGVAAVAAATKAWADYNDEINRQNTMTTVVTGLKGDAADELTMGVRALARTYDVDFRQAIEAANTLMQQFGVTGEQALSLLQDGMQGMIAGDGGKLLSMIQQYAPSFRDAGIEASQLVAIIQNSEGGLFTEQNMNAIVMGIRNIRHQTKATRDALAGLGIDGEEMTRKLNDGTMTVFEALQEVAGAIDNVRSGSDEAGAVMQNVFGRQGTMAGTKLGEAIATLNTNLQETKKQTGELGESFVRLNEANLRLERTMQEIFGMTGWEDMSNTIKTQFAESLSDALQYLIDVRDALNGIGSYDSFETLADAARRFVPALWPILKGLQEMKGLLNDIKSAWNGITGNTPEQQQPQQQTTQQKPVQNGYQVTTDKNGKVVRESRIVNGEKKDVAEQPKQQTNQRTYEQVKADLDRAKKELENAKDAISRGTAKSLVDYYEQELKRIPKQDVKQDTKNTNTNFTSTTTKKDTWAPIEMKPVEAMEIKGRSINDVTKEIQQAQAQFNAAGDEMGRAMAKSMLEALKAEKDAMMAEGDVKKGGFADAYNYDFGKDIKKLETKPADNLVKSGKATAEAWREAASAIGSVGNALSGLEDPSAKIVGTVGQAIAQIALGFAQASAADSKLGVFGWIASVAGGLGTMLSTISAIHNATGYANGGVVKYDGGGGVIPGNSFSGDNLRMIGVNSGEIIMNVAQGNNVANALLSRQQGGSVDVQPWVDGERVFLGMNNSLQRKGRGEIVTTSMLKQKGIL